MRQYRSSVIPVKTAIGFTHLWRAISRPNTAHTPLTREAGRGRGPLRSNGRVRGLPVSPSHPARFFAVPFKFCTNRPGAPHPPNADALGPSLSPLSRGEVYRAIIDYP